MSSVSLNIAFENNKLKKKKVHLFVLPPIKVMFWGYDKCCKAELMFQNCLGFV